jgi:transposase
VLIPRPTQSTKSRRATRLHFTPTFFQLLQLYQFEAEMRAFGIELSANIRSIHGNRRELTTEERASIVSARMAGITRKALADNFNCSPLTITRTCNHFKLHGTVESLPRSGRPLKLSPQQIKYIRILIKRNPHIGWAALCNSGPIKITRNTLRAALGQAFRRKWRSIKRIRLTAERAATRLIHAKENRRKVAMLMEVSCLAQVVLMEYPANHFSRAHTPTNPRSKQHHIHPMAGFFECLRINTTKPSSISRPT